jgi:hypothetical protein
MIDRPTLILLLLKIKETAYKVQRFNSRKMPLCGLNRSIDTPFRTLLLMFFVDIHEFNLTYSLLGLNFEKKAKG